MKNDFLLSVVSLLACLLVIETCYRFFSPFPPCAVEQINRTEYGNLTMYDPLLGWCGVPNGKARLATCEATVSLAHNSLGFRDIEHSCSQPEKPQIAFLGDSFTWGYSVEYDEMFVNLLRKRLPDFDLVNLSHGGYGTDQELLTFQNWCGKPGLVVLMFCENDFADNGGSRRYGKNKPLFALNGNRLKLTKVPVPRVPEWKDPPLTPPIKRLNSPFHFMNDLYFRLTNDGSKRRANDLLPSEPDVALTAAIIRQLKFEVKNKGGKLAVVAIPSKFEIEKLRNGEPYQRILEKIVLNLDLPFLDLAPFFKGRIFKSYYPLDAHWTPRGHRIAADAMVPFLSGLASKDETAKTGACHD